MLGGMLNGKTILLTHGRATETIDGVRHYANHRMAARHGQEVADALEGQGARVVRVQATGSAALLADACKAVLAAQAVDAVVHAASVSSLKAKTQAAQKLKLKHAATPVTLEVTGNIDVLVHFRKALPPPVPLVGYDREQILRMHEGGALENALARVIRAASENERSIPALTWSSAKEGSLRGKTVIVTSGPTVEIITSSGDGFSNVSSGRQGRAVAEAFARAGGRVIFISGIQEDSACGIYAPTASAMLEAVLNHLPADAYVGVAAVADFAAEAIAAPLQEGEERTLTLKQNPDILHTVATHPLRPRAVIGFAAETEHLLAHATQKLLRKNADAICANIAAEAMGGEHTRITWVTREGVEPWGAMLKEQAAAAIAGKLARMLI